MVENFDFNYYKKRCTQDQRAISISEWRRNLLLNMCNISKNKSSFMDLISAYLQNNLYVHWLNRVETIIICNIVQHQDLITSVKQHQQQMQTEINSIFEHMFLWEPMLVHIIIDYVLKNDFENNIFI